MSVSLPQAWGSIPPTCHSPWRLRALLVEAAVQEAMTHNTLLEDPTLSDEASVALLRQQVQRGTVNAILAGFYFLPACETHPLSQQSAGIATTGSVSRVQLPWITADRGIRVTHNFWADDLTVPTVLEAPACDTLPHPCEVYGAKAINVINLDVLVTAEMCSKKHPNASVGIVTSCGHETIGDTWMKGWCGTENTIKTDELVRACLWHHVVTSECSRSYSVAHVDVPVPE